MALGLTRARTALPDGVDGQPLGCPCVQTVPAAVDPRCPEETWSGQSRATVVEAGTKKVRQANKTRKGTPSEARRLAAEALHIYDCALRRDSKDTRVLGDMGWAFALAGDWAGAVRSYERAIRTEGHPRLVAAAHFGRGEALCEMGRPKEALDSMRQSLLTPTKDKTVEQVGGFVSFSFVLM